MKAEETRIGNLLYRDGVVVTIDARSIFDIWTHDPEDYGYKPIPLTDVYLIKFGFHYDLDRSEFFKEFNRSSLYIDSEYNVFIAGDEICKLRYVHQLQNLFYSMTGKELTI